MTFIHSTRPASNKPPRPISIRLTVQLPPIVLGAGVQLLVDDLAVDRIKDDHRVILHTQAGGSIDPVTLPAGFTQAREYFVGVVATLAGQNHVEGFQFFDAVSILQWGNILAHCRALATDIGCGEEHRLNKIEILLFQHPLHEHGTDHTAPTDQTYTFHRNYTFFKKWAAAFEVESGSGPERLQIPQRGDYCVTHFLRTDFSATGRPDVAGAQALVQNQTDGLLDRIGCILQIEAVTQHHRHRQNGRQRVGNAFASDVRRRTVARLVHAFVVGVQGRRRQHADGTGEHRGLVGQDVAEQVVGNDHVELLRCAHQLHGGVVDVHVAQFDFRVILGHLLDHFTPQLAGRQHVGLVHRAQLFAADHGHVETDTGDAADFAFAVRQGVVGLTLTVFKLAHAAWRAEVDAAGQLADDQ